MSDPLFVTLQITPRVTDEALALLAEVAEPVRIRTPRGQPAIDTAKRFYGAAEPRMAKFLRTFQSKPPESESADYRHIFLPAGPRWKVNVKYAIPRDSTISHVAFDMMGSANPKTLKTIADLNTDLHLDKVAAGRKVVLPFSARVVSYPLRPVYQTQGDLIASLFASDPGIAKVEVGHPFRLVPQWTAARLTSGSPKCSGPLVDNWHAGELFNNVDLSKLPFAWPAVVAILDGGLLKDDGRFANVLWSNSEEAGRREGYDDDGNGYTDDVIGWNFVEEGYPVDDVDAEDLRHHGTHIAGLVAGRTLSVELAKKLEGRVRVMILKVARRDGQVDLGAVHDAIAYARNAASPIVNLSFEGKYSKQTHESMRDAKELLFVVAAGNGRNFRGVDLDMDVEKVFPAKHARDLPNVISVAAHGPTGDLACFSNFGSKTIDIAAPGIEILSTVDGGSAKLSGTSQATPLVAMAASLLVALDVRRPDEIKRRLMASVDFVPELRGKIVSEGKLNLAKALAVEDDVLQLTDGSLVKGTIRAPKELHISGEPQPLPLTAVQKVIFNYGSDAGARDRIAVAKAKTLQYMNIPSVIDEVVVDLADGSTVTYRRDQLRDLVPATRRRKSRIQEVSTPDSSQKIVQAPN